jgi:hypothetical protein
VLWVQVSHELQDADELEQFAKEHDFERDERSHLTLGQACKAQVSNGQNYCSNCI